MKIEEIIFQGVTCPPTQSIIVVTSPIGDHAPPALAEIIIIPANIHKSFLSFIILDIKAAMTIDVVKLSSTAEKKKEIIHKIHINGTFLLVVILSVIIENPW